MYTTTIPVSKARALSVNYIVEERLIASAQETFFAWCFETQEEAEVQVMDLLRRGGEGKLYSMYIDVVIP